MLTRKRKAQKLDRRRVHAALCSRGCFIPASVLLLILCCAGALAVGAQSAPPVPAATNGAECLSCHAEETRSYPDNPHGKQSVAHGNSAVGCEACHGPGQAHVEAGGDKTKIFSPADATAAKASESCLGCHKDRHTGYERVAHGQGNAGCLGCHSIHKSADKNLLRAAEPALCYGCHADQKEQFALAVHHKVDEGLMRCSDCHDPHGDPPRKNLRSTAAMSAICTRCHTETAGPWKHEHAAVKTEGCTGCHLPHGGAYPRLLTRENVNTVCLFCHSGAVNFTSATPQPAHTPAAQKQPCTGCHAEVHGSNTSPLFLHAGG